MEDILDINSQGNNERQAKLPNAVAVLVLGILSLVMCFAYGVFGLILGIIALALHKKDKNMYQSSPQKFEESYKLSRAGFICAIIGTSLSALFILVVIFIFVGVASGGGFLR